MCISECYFVIKVKLAYEFLIITFLVTRTIEHPRLLVYDPWKNGPDEEQASADWLLTDDLHLHLSLKHKAHHEHASEYVHRHMGIFQLGELSVSDRSQLF